MFRKKIRSICDNPRRHPFPVHMRYSGTGWWGSRRVHVMYCPVCGQQRYYIYTFTGRIRRVA